MGQPDLAGFLHVVAAVIRNGRGQVLIARRNRGADHDGLWEFPGGKLEPGEQPFAALCRELEEELGIAVTGATPLIRIPHRYPDKSVLLDVWDVDRYEGTPHGREGQPLMWADLPDLATYAFPGANLPVISALSLPRHYLITPEPGPEPDWELFLERLAGHLERGIRLVQLRAKALEREPFRRLAAAVRELCAGAGAKLLLNADGEGVDAVGADGLHLTACQLASVGGRPLGPDRLVAASCHTREDVEKASSLGLDFIVVSPVQTTASHPEAAPLGWVAFEQLVAHSPLPVYALGGMGEGDVARVRRHGGHGIAAIRALWHSDTPIGDGHPGSEARRMS